MKAFTILALALCLFSCGSDDSAVSDMTPDEPIVTSTNIQTNDGISIFTTIVKPATLSAASPAIIFIHGNNSDGRVEWVNNDLFDLLVEEGYILVAYDIRTYGNSGDDGGTRGGLLNDPDRAPLDLDAVVAFLKTDSDIDPLRIGSIGSKLGAEVALVGLAKGDLKTVVGLSIIRTGYASLAANVEDPQLKSVFYIASENESNGVPAADAEQLLALTDDPKKLVIIPSSSNTGADLLADDTTLSLQIITWLNDHL